MGLTDDEFGELTPELFDALLKRRHVQSKEDCMRAGVIAACVVNSSMGAPDKAYGPADFFPFLKEDVPPVDLTKMSPEQQAAFVRSMFSKASYRRK